MIEWDNRAFQFTEISAHCHCICFQDIIKSKAYLKKVIVKDLPLYKGVWSYVNHGVAPFSELMQQ